MFIVVVVNKPCVTVMLTNTEQFCLVFYFYAVKHCERHNVISHTVTQGGICRDSQWGGGTRLSGRSTSAQDRPFSAIPRDSVTRTCPSVPPPRIPPWLHVFVSTKVTSYNESINNDDGRDAGHVAVFGVDLICRRFRRRCQLVFMCYWLK